MARFGDDSASAYARNIEDPGSLTLADVQVIESDLRSNLLRLQRNALMEEIGVFTGRWRQNYEPFSRPYTTPIGRAFWDYWYDDSVGWMRDMQVVIDRSAPTMESGYFNLLRESVNADQD